MDKQRDAWRDSQKDMPADKETERRMNTYTDRPDRPIDSLMSKQTDEWTDIQTSRLIYSLLNRDRRMDKCTDKQTDIQADEQTDRQMYIQTD
jgi:hypothetical protein